MRTILLTILIAAALGTAEDPDPAADFRASLALIDAGEVMPYCARYIHSDDQALLTEVIAELGGEEAFVAMFTERKAPRMREMDQRIQGLSPQRFERDGEAQAYFPLDPAVGETVGLLLHLEDGIWKVRNSSNLTAADVEALRTAELIE